MTSRPDDYTDLDRAIESNRWETAALFGIALLAFIVAAPHLISLGWELLAAMQPRPAACEGLTGAECWALAQAGGL